MARSSLGRFLRAAGLTAAVALGLLGGAVIFQPTRNALAYGVLSVAFALRGMSFHAAALHLGADRVSIHGLEVDDRHGLVLRTRQLDVAYDARALFARPPRPN